MSYDLDLEVVRDLHPPAPRDEAVRERALAALMAEIEPSGRRAPRRRLLAPAGVLAAAVAVGAAFFVALSLRGGVANPPSAAAALLERAARVAAASGGPRRLRPGEYWYVKSVWTTPTAVVPNRTGHGVTVIINALTRTERQVWIGVDRPGRVVTRNAGPITFLSAAARREWIRAGGTRPMTGVNGPLPANAFVWPAGVAGRPNRATAYQQLLALPTNVDALWRVIYRGAGQGSAAWKRHEMFTEIGDLLREDPIPAKVRAALYRVAARIPGIQLLGLTRDALGRPALAVSLNDVLYGMRDELLFDPRTAALLGEASVVVKPPPTYHVKPGSVRSGATYVMSGIVERIGQVPAR